MNITVTILFIAASMVNLLTTVIMFIANKKNRGRMSLGGKKFMFFTALCFFLCISMTVGSIALTVMSIIGSAEIPAVAAAVVLVCAVFSYVFLFHRKLQNDGMSLMMQKNESIKASRSYMLSSISHEIRTPMNTILGLTEIISHRDDVPTEVKIEMDNIAAAGSELLSVVNNLIDFSKIDNGRLEIIEDEYETRELVGELIRKTEAMLQQSNVEFLADVDSKIPSKLCGDDIRIIQAVTNILTNACQNTHVGVITLHITYIEEDDGSIELKFDVEDTGIGIRDENKAHIFESYDDGTRSLDKSGTGAGLGLKITKSIVELMHGKISFVSEVGEGSTFTVVIPQKVVDGAPMGALHDTNGALPGQNYGFTLPMAKVLVVDDNIVNLFVARQLLENYSIDVETVESGEKAIAALKENFYDIVFMDYVMPDMDGLETLHAIRECDTDYMKRVPVVALTAQIISGAEKVYIEEGFQGYLSKPINISDLERLLVRILPEEYICYKEKTREEMNLEGIEEKAWFKRFCNILKGFDVRKGLASCNNDYTTYINHLRNIYNDGFARSGKLLTLYEDGNIEDFRMLVHSLRSLAGSAGAERLNSILVEHENAAKDNDLAFIRNNINQLISEFESFLGQIELLLQRESEVMNRGYVTPKSNADSVRIKMIVDDLVLSLADFDIDSAERGLAELGKINLNSERARAIESATDMLKLFKYDEAAAIIKDAFAE